ncbi:MAG: EVE domain-containing protein [Candidatus Caenarcaniphilales bacterium]|nr:EVE domain-containing protein [Candidatus Caenarcaniphilales bacterium]
MSKYWLMKSEPNAFSIDDLKALPKQTDMWDGVRNYQARNIMRDEMQQGDKVFFYHSNATPPGIVGVAEIASEKAYPDPTQFDEKSKYYDPKSDPEKPRWYLVDVKFVQDLPMISLEQLKANPKLADMKVVQKGARLSVQPVSEQEWNEVLSMAQVKA